LNEFKLSPIADFQLPIWFKDPAVLSIGNWQSAMTGVIVAAAVEDYRGETNWQQKI